MEWISVKDRLPENQLVTIAVLLDTGNIELAFISILGEYFKSTINGKEITNVTHWCSLPEKPKK